MAMRANGPLAVCHLPFIACALANDVVASINVKQRINRRIMCVTNVCTVWLTRINGVSFSIVFSSDADKGARDENVSNQESGVVNGSNTVRRRTLPCAPCGGDWGNNHWPHNAGWTCCPRIRYRLPTSNGGTDIQGCEPVCTTIPERHHFRQRQGRQCKA